MPVKFVNVESEYEKNKDLKRESVLALQDWADKQPHLPKLNELHIILFLQSCYYSNEAAKMALDNFYTIRTHAPELFSNRDPTKLKEHMNVVAYGVLPQKTKEGYNLLYSKIVEPQAEKYVFTEQLKVYDMTIYLEHILNGTSEGNAILLDMDGSTISHMARMNILVVKKFLYYVQEALPIRLKEIHVMNAMPFVDKLLALVKPFMKKELLSILHVHTTLDSLYKCIPKDCLPKEYGGSAGTVKEICERNMNRLVANRDFFLEDEKQCVDESKRPGKPKNPGEIFGMEGTFKKLDID